MGKAISSALGSAAGSGGSALGQAASNVVSPVIVQAASKGASSALGSTLGRALGAGASSLSGAGSAAGQMPTSQAQTTAPVTANENTVDPITVTAPRLAETAPSSIGSSLIPAVLGALGSGGLASYTSAPSSASSAPLANTESTQLSPIEVTAAMQSAGDSSGLSGGLAAGLGGALSGSDSTDFMSDGMDGEGADTLDGANGEGGVDAKDAGMLALLAGLGLKPKDLLGMGLLGAGLVTGSKGGGSDANTDQLTTIAGDTKQLANMMSQRVQAGLDGQIGGMGMNAIKRMVRNAQAAIRQRYSGMGMSGSTAEIADLNAAAESGVDMQFKIGQQTAQSGLSAVAALTGQSANIYAQLMNAQTQKDTALGNALANFAGAVGGRLLAG